MVVAAGLRSIAVALLGTMVALLLAFPAVAQWQLLEEVDGAGQPTYTLRGALGDKGLLQVWCSTTDRQIALLTFDGENSIPEPSGNVVALRIQTDVGEAWQSPADFYRHAPGWYGMRYRNGAADARAIVEDIVAAKSSISVVMVQTVSGKEYPYSLSAKGSTAAGRAFIEKCFGAKTVAQPALALSAWEVRIEPDPVNGGQQATLVGDLDQGGYFYAFCDGRRQSEVAFLASNPSTFPYEAGDVGLTLRVEIDGEQRSATGEHFTRPDGIAGIRYLAADYIESLILAVGAAKSEVAMTIESYSSGMVTRWPAMNLQGLAQAAAQFSAQCFGTSPAVAELPAQPEVAPAQGGSGPDWTLRSQPSETLPDHTLIATTSDGKASLLLACDTAGQPVLGIEVQPGVIADTAPATESLTVNAGSHRFPFIVESWSEEALRYLQSTNVYQISDMVVRLAIGVTDLQLSIATASGATYTGSLSTGVEAAAAAEAFAKLCLSPDDYWQIGYLPLTEATGWELIDGEAAAMLNARAVLHARTSPKSGRVEFICFVETGAHTLAFYSDDALKQNALKEASIFELVVFIGEDGYWPVNEPRRVYSGTELGIGTVNQENIREMLDALSHDPPPEMTISTRANFGDYEPYKIPLSNSSLVATYVEACRLP
ncbi:MAG: hypothetical protein IPK28_05510 [Devosia sp.]|nr:hypothetical protein [Devosia sp.]